VPGCTVDDVFAGRPVQRAVYDAVAHHLATLGPVHVDAVGVGVFLKTERKLAELRPKSRWLSLELVLDRPVKHPLITRRIRISEDRITHVVRLATVEDFDETVRDWLNWAYDAATG
jgi:hypothetical protein